MSRNFNVAKVKYGLKKHAPDIALFGGAASVMVGVVLACKSTLKLEETKKKNAKEINLAHEWPDGMEDSEYKKNLTLTYARCGFNYVKLYGVPSVLIFGGLSCMIGSNLELKKRNATLSLAYTTLSKSFDAYRKKVVDKYGEDTDFRFVNDIQEEQITVEEEDENGKKKKKKKKVEKAKDYISSNSRFYDELCSDWTEDPEYNLAHLKAVETFVNNKFQANGFMFLNEVYNALGIAPSSRGQVEGWVYDEEDPKKQWIDFGIYSRGSDGHYINKDAIGGIEPIFLLNFKTDGNIMEDVWKVNPSLPFNRR